MQLLVALAYLHTNNNNTQAAAQIIRDFKTQWNQWAKQLTCEEHQGKTLAALCQLYPCPDLQVTLPAKARVSDTERQVDLREGYETEKIIYRFAPADSAQAQRLNLIEAKPAQAILNKTLGIDVAGQIVFIGVTHPDDRDYHPIPIRYKDVAGVYILANAVDTLLRFGQFQPQSLQQKLILSIILILVISWIFTYFKICIAFLFSSFILLGLVVGSLLELSRGAEMDFIIQLIMIKIFRFLIWLWYKLREIRGLLKSCRHEQAS